MTVTFTATPDHFDSTINASDYASIVAVPGLNSMGTVVGADGNDYVVLACSNAGNSPKTAFCLWNIHTGTFFNYTDSGLDLPQDIAILPVPGTKYIWLFWTTGTNHATFIWHGRCLSVLNGSTLGAAAEQGGLLAESPFLESWADDNTHACYYNKYDGTYMVMLRNVRHGTVSSSYSAAPYFIMNMGGTFTMSFSSLKDESYVDWKSKPFIGVNGTGSGPNPWSGPIEPFLLDNAFFAMFSGGTAPIQNNGGFTIGVDPSTHAFYGLFYIGQVQWDYIQDHFSDSRAFAEISGVGLYRYNFPTALLPDPNVGDIGTFTWWLGFGDSIELINGPVFPESNRHLDGTVNSATTPSGRPPDDYASLNCFSFPGDKTNQYVVMARSYSRREDVGTTGSGTYVRVKIYRYWPSVHGFATLVFDESYSIFDTVADIGLAEVDRNHIPPDFIQVVQNSDRNLYYIFGQPSDAIVGSGIYAAGQLVDIFGPPVGETYTSYMDTWWTLSDGAALWAENPYLITYVDNTQTTPSLFVTPRWEWTESDTNHKSGPQVQVYKDRPGTVSDVRSRIRGKGRALQFRFESEDGKPFNLLGWTINLDKNSQF